jgi:acetyltransferase-like isoleucine patch superfamily enzyme
MKNIIKSALYFFLRIFYKDLNKDEGLYPIRTLYKYAIKQKIFKYNSKVQWPVHFTSQVKCSEKIQRGTKYPGYAKGCYIDGRNGIVFEENVITGPHVSIISQNHNLSDFNTYLEGKPILIRKNSWLSARCIILPEVELGEHTIVAAGAVVTKSFPEGNQIIGGNPAKVIKKIGVYIEK